MPLGVPPLAFAWSLPAAAPGAAAGCWACTKRVISAARAATNTGAVRSFMTHDCTRYGGRLLRGIVAMVLEFFAPWSSAGDPARAIRTKRVQQVRAEDGSIQARKCILSCLK